MVSMVEIQCPHCSTRGKVMLPPLGAILVGTCPHCDGMVGVFCGSPLALDKDTVLHGTPDQKFDHLMDALSGFLEKHVSRIVDEIGKEQFGENQRRLYDQTAEQAVEALADADAMAPDAEEDDGISSEEVDQFVQVELPLLDDAAYFRAIFE
jgi:hypothetical protein